MMIVDAKYYGHSCYEVNVRTHDETEYNAIHSYAKLLNKTAKPMTNGDRIRAMSDEELARVISDGGCPPKISEIVCDTTDDCYVCWSNWLKQPAEV